MTALLPDWMTRTAPVDYYDPDDPVIQAMLAEEEQPRTADGRFTFRPVEYAHLTPAVRIDRPAGGAAVISYEGASHTTVRVVAGPDGGPRVLHVGDPAWDTATTYRTTSPSRRTA